MMAAFEFSDRTLEELERIQGGGTGRGKIDRRGNRALTKAIARMNSIPFGAASSVGAGLLKPSSAQRTARALQGLSRTTNRAPQVMVKITSRLHGSASTLGAMTYVTRLGMTEKEPLELETSEGAILTRADQMQQLAREWQLHEMSGEARRKGATAIAMVFSMPPGTDADKVRAAVKALAESDLNNRRWAMTLHIDEPHPHVHLIMAARDHDGVRINPNREFIQLCRERFAENLRNLGIDADATKRVARGYPPKRDALPVRKIRDDQREVKSDSAKRAMLDFVTPDAKAQFAERERQRSRTAENAELVKGVYARAIGELEAHGGQEEVERARALKMFVQDMPEPATARAEMVERLKAGNALAPDHAPDPALEKLKARVSAKAAPSDALDRLKNNTASLKAKTQRASDEELGKGRAGEGNAAPGDDQAIRLAQLRAAAERLKQSTATEQSRATDPAQVRRTAEKLQATLKKIERSKDRTLDKDQDREGPTR